MRKTNLCIFFLSRLRHLSSSFYSTSTLTSSSTSNSIQSLNKFENPNSSFSKFLVDSLGFSNADTLTTSAKLASWRRHHQSINNNKNNEVIEFDFDFVDNANSVIQFFLQLGFQRSEIRRIVCYHPRYLLSRVNTTLKPKIEVLLEVGFSRSDLIHAILSNPLLLCFRLRPIIDALRVVLGNDDDVVIFLKRYTRVHFSSLARMLIPNVNLLQDCYGISGVVVRRHFLRQPNIFIARSDCFRDIVAKVENKLGIPRHSAMFLYGVHLLSQGGEKNLEGKFAVFSEFGWTRSDIMKLIRRNPLCFVSSEARIKKRLGFLMNQLGLKPISLVTHAALFTCSLEKRLLPRHRVLQVLIQKGLCKTDYSITTLAGMSESQFMERFVLPFEEIHQVYAQLKGCKVGSPIATKGEL